MTSLISRSQPCLLWLWRRCSSIQLRTPQDLGSSFPVVEPDRNRETRKPLAQRNILAVRRAVRMLERRWKWTELKIDKDIILNELRNLRWMIESAKINYLGTKIRDSTMKKSLFRLVDSLFLVKPPENQPGTVDHAILLNHLPFSFEVSGTALSCIRSYLVNRKRAVLASRQLTEAFCEMFCSNPSS